MKGSIEITDWLQEGVIWRTDNWTYKFTPTSNSDAIDPAYPMAKYPDQAFIDGKSLKQVATKAEVVPGAFFVDYATHQLFIGDNPAGRTVEASVHVFAIKFQFGSDGSTVRGLGFMHYAPNHSLENGPAMIVGNAQRLTFENNTFAYSANRGLSVFGMDAVIRGNIFIYNGEGGLGGYKSDRTLIEGNYIGYNNTEHFKLGWDANGAKFANSSSLIWRDNIVEYNLGGGLWCDYQCRDNVFVRNIVRYNGLHNGLFYEISQGGIIASNLIYGNEGSGIGLSQSSGTKIYNNTLSKNGVNIAADSCSSNTIAKNNILSNISDTLGGTYASLHTDCSNSRGDVIVSQLDHNAYYRTSSAPPQQGLIVWAGYGRYNNLAAFQKAQKKEVSGIAIDDQPTNPFFMDEANGNYHLKASSPAKAKGEPLPKDVATAIGISSGVPVDIGALIWPGSTSTPIAQTPEKTPTPKRK
jgi:parallel beta-helix repeat protein